VKFLEFPGVLVYFVAKSCFVFEKSVFHSRSKEIVTARVALPSTGDAPLRSAVTLAASTVGVSPVL
jgi:hypothetical protein